jgi:hypothetical protein
MQALTLENEEKLRMDTIRELEKIRIRKLALSCRLG